MDKIGKTKLSMAKLGWNIEEIIIDEGGGDSIGSRKKSNNKNILIKMILF